jgi:hypothetical protein
MNFNQTGLLKQCSRIVLVLFFCSSLFVGLVGSFIQSDSMPNFREQRTLASFPSFAKLKTLNDFANSITKFSADNFGFRKRLLSIYFKFRLDILKSDFGLPGLLGNNDWLFIDGEISTFRKEHQLSAVQIEQIRYRLDAWCEYAHQQGAEFVFFVAPNKSTIYPEKVASYLQRYSDHNSSMDLINGLKFSCPFIKVDLRNTLIKHNNELLYYTWGTHWNERGAQLSWSKIKDEVSSNLPHLSWPNIQSSISYRPAQPIEDSMWQWFGQADPYTVMLPSITVTKSPEFSSSPQSQTNKAKTIAFGDSFLQFMFNTSGIIADNTSNWNLQVNEKLIIHPGDVDKDAWIIKAPASQSNIEIINQFKPNLVLLEIVERNIVSLADLQIPSVVNKTYNQGEIHKYNSAIHIADLLGPWKAGNAMGRVDSVGSSDLLVTTETGLKGRGVIIGDHIDINAWHVTGKLSLDKKEIHWSNDFVWTR